MKLVIVFVGIFILNGGLQAQKFSYKQKEIGLNMFFERKPNILRRDSLTFFIIPLEVCNSKEAKVEFLIDANSMDSKYGIPKLASNEAKFDSVKWNMAFRKEKELEVNLMIIQESSDIKLKDDQFLRITSNNSADSYLLVRYKSGEEEEATLPTPRGFTYLNALNFDFGNSKGSPYVGHLNIFNPNLCAFKKGTNKQRHGAFGWFGLDFGVMQIDYSRRGDSSNASYDQVEFTKINPLDSAKIGAQFLRQYNRTTNTAKNSTLSMYFQPMTNLISNEETKLMLHLHVEFFVSKWTVITNIKNLQQLTDTINSKNFDTVSRNITNVNKFSHSLSDPISSESENTTMSISYGFGLTYYQKIWKNGYLFLQPTIGGVTAYSRPTSVNAKSLVVNNYTDNKGWFHLTRVEVQQQLTKNLQAILGLNVVGKFGYDPSYALYLGANLGLSGVRKLLMGE